MRIVGGSLRGRKIAVPNSRLRPTSELVREALMSILGPTWDGRRVLDCFAGSGAFGFETLSRGASECVFVEINARSCRHLADTARALDVGDRVRIERGDSNRVLQRLQRANEAFDVLFFDPPYRGNLLDKALALAEGLANPGAWVLAEHAPDEKPTVGEGLSPSDQRRYGGSVVSIFDYAKDREVNG